MSALALFSIPFNKFFIKTLLKNGKKSHLKSRSTFNQWSLVVNFDSALQFDSAALYWAKKASSFSKVKVK